MNNQQKSNANILILAPFPPPYGGMGVRFERMAESLEANDIKIERVRLDSAKGFFWRLICFIKASCKVVRMKVSIVHTVTGSIPNFIMLSTVIISAKLAGKKVILSNGGGFWLRESQRTGLRSSLVRIFLKLPDVLIGCNRELVDAMLALNVQYQKIHLITNALPNECGTRSSIPLSPEIKKIRNSHDILLLYVGAMQSWYGLFETVELLAELRLNGIDAALIALVKKGGNKDYLSSIIERVQSLSLQSAFSIYTSVSWAVSAMALSDVVIRATNIVEGDSRAIREALAIGVPVIASDIGYRPDGVILFKAGDVSSMQKAVEKALNISSHNVTKPDNKEGKDNIRRIMEIYKQLQD